MSKRLRLAALQGSFGDRIFYAALISMRDLVERISFTEGPHGDAAVGEPARQGPADDDRAAEFAKYLIEAEDRFSGSLVVGDHGSRIAWHPLKTDDPSATNGPDLERMGFIELRGDERLFVIDGRHRLAGMRKALQKDDALADESVSLLIVAHANSPEGMKRTRNMAIALNKRALPVDATTAVPRRKGV